MSSKKNSCSPPSIPSDESERLEELYALEILDTAADERYDQWTRLAAEVLDVPIALISLVDKERQWFKSKTGIDASETPRDISFCGHAIHLDDFLIVPDATKDSRFAENPLVTGDPNIKFYAGAVIRGPSGKKIGTCCIIDREPREIGTHEKKILKMLGGIIEWEIRTESEFKRLREKVRQTALYDPFTNLPNRTLFMDRLKSIINSATNTENRLLLTLVRIDRFAQIEGARGNPEASKLIGELGSKLMEIIGPASFVGRWQDDTLSIVAPLDNHDLDLFKLIDSILGVFKSPGDEASSSLIKDVSLGASIWPDDANDALSLVENATAAVRANPVHEGVAYRFYTTDLKSQIIRGFEIEQGLRAALKSHDEFHLVFQPKVDIKEGTICGAEALLRWNSKTLGNVSPAEFIPIAEQYGMTINLGCWVLHAACEQKLRWDEKGMRALPISVNVTSRQLRQPDFTSTVLATLEETGMNPAFLKLELTEGSLIEDTEGAIKIMNNLKRLGVSFSIDDFGTGFSSLSYLRQMPINELKIDRSFVQDLATQSADAKIAQGIVNLSHGLDIKVVAEGVETQEQLTFLHACQCDEIQGYLFSPPVDADAFFEMVTQNKKL